MIIKNKKFLKDKLYKGKSFYWDYFSLYLYFEQKYIYILKKDNIYKKEIIYKYLNQKEIEKKYGKEKYISLYNELKEKMLEENVFLFSSPQNNLKQILKKYKEKDKIIIDIYNKNLDYILKKGKFIIGKEEVLINKFFKKEDIEKDFNFVFFGFLSFNLEKKINKEKDIIVTKNTKEFLIENIKDYFIFPFEEKSLLKPVFFSKKTFSFLNKNNIFEKLEKNKEYTGTQILSLINKKGKNWEEKKKENYTAPKWYRKIENKRIKNHLKKELLKNMKKEEYDKIINGKYVKNGSWYY